MTTSRREKGAYDGDTAKALTTAEFDGNFFVTTAQTAHGLAQGDLVYLDSSGDWIKAIGGAVAADEVKLADGVVQFSIDSDNVQVAVIPCAVAAAAHGFTVGAVLYLSQSTAGDATDTKPTSGWIQKVGKVINANNWLFRPGPGEFV